VRNIEQADGRARGLVFGDDRGVLDGHRPAGEIDQPAAMRGVPVVKRRLGQGATHP
jgi:hypothetical protein